MSTYTAKRLGWDEELTSVQDADLAPFGEDRTTGVDLSGDLETVVTDSGLTVHLVGGQEADPKTITQEKTVAANAATDPPYLDALADLLDVGEALSDWREAVFLAALSAGVSPEAAIDLAANSPMPHGA